MALIQFLVITTWNSLVAGVTFGLCYLIAVVLTGRWDHWGVPNLGWYIFALWITFQVIGWLGALSGRVSSGKSSRA